MMFENFVTNVFFLSYAYTYVKSLIVLSHIIENGKYYSIFRNVLNELKMSNLVLSH